MNATEEAAMQLIVPLAEAGDAPRTLVGGKARELGRLLADGVDVPDGFVVTTAARGVTDELRAAVTDALAGLPGPLAYRSSGVAEDLADASFAGQYDTVLGVEGIDDGFAALERCWASAEGTAATAYRSEQGQTETAMAVLVQSMVDARAAGVTFTANPVTGAEEIVVEATAGLGAALMDGDITPERWVIASAPRLEANGDAGTVLTEADVATVADRCAEIAARAGEPLDIEWALDGDRLRILQARPITALPVAPTVAIPENQTWLRSDAYCPTPLTPFAYSAWLPHHTRAFAEVTAHFGLPFERIDHRHWYGRVYDRIVPVGEPARDRPLPPRPILKLAVRLAPPFRRRLTTATLAAEEDRPMAVLDAWEDGGRDARRARTRELRDTDRTALTDAELAAHLQDAHTGLLGAGIDHFMVALGGTFILSGQLGLLMEDLLGWEPARVLDLLQGFGDATVTQGRELDELVGRVATDPDARRLLDDDPAALVDHPGPGGAALREFIDRHGHRVIAPDMQDPTWAEDPAPLVRMVAARIDEEREVANPKTAAREAEAEALASITDPADRDRFLRALERARRGRPYGDETETDVSDMMAVIRYIALEAGARLAGARRIPHPDDIWFLTVDEAAAALRGEPVPSDLDRRRAEHRWALANPSPERIGPDPGEPPDPSVFPARSRPIAGAAMWTLRLHQPAPTAQDGDGLRGLPASPGRVTGTARIIASPAEFDRVRPGDIMVCHHTMAAWSPIFPILGGLVTEHGGPLSHPGTLAREYGLPAVLALPGATDLFTDGQLITVDGGTGRVEAAE